MAEVLALAASPTFAMMALLTSVVGGGPLETLCASATASPLSGMATMYLLMSAFHAAPWLRFFRGEKEHPDRRFALSGHRLRDDER